MGLFTRIEDGLESAIEGAAGTLFKTAVEPAQIAKRAEKEMRREKLIGAGRQYAPALYNVMLAPEDCDRLGGFFTTMAAEIETFIMGAADEDGLDLPGRPLVRFIEDDALPKGKFEVIAENVSTEILEQLREEERELYGLPAAQSAKPAVAATPSRIEPTPSPAVPAAEVAAAAAAGVAVGTPSAAEAAVASADTVAAQPARDPFLVDTATQAAYALRKSRLIVGREVDCDIVLRDGNISRHHAELIRDATGAWNIRDLGSLNGTRINNVAIAQSTLRDGDLITLGLTILEFRY